ncbi:YihY/virulence factor BrkB family protein [Lentilactobacillus hilgardii]|uniref:YihY family protein n=1 Tax=Lentilactobacillus hilgardii (strain ATCC 8290 / DSM 20176 / CCUG 30140 / JCM 1155 / KCTC 3500 / NBRC 15886 / NCIMB 8040 / NRRL B-1843 / 9) TaxID=1423757 RepID=C0XHS3_LENH9|nr:YihY/virulence factor BrkB family protein [Lentilactobacillus hilgardii]EEI19119.1 YihY family protein [Lentilactobacillus buchneri ATCC 11577]EEI25068.1 YihY family protein [Lentilactobacillus hilgardii DSM 20176 = ATCC 8290]KRK59301.1 ribonuclease BN [Lentilactobacillus hilgardii DSM 20176 = ATCC 8290]MCP9332992.1 YihY/virulence factor BrkB family protein [Lentilactobacillus hilgardii]MCP9349601.1 YihY/virulence factor BrkB family protein [Lentilactobacillus hilgardii]
MIKSIYLKTKQFIQTLVSHYSQGDVSDSAAVLAFYSLMSIFPILFIGGSILNLFQIHTGDIMEYVRPIFPDRIYVMLEPVIDSTLRSGGTSQLSIGLIVTIWSASRAIAAFQRSINKAYGVAEDQTAISNRILSFLWMLLLIVVVVAVMIAFALSQFVFSWLSPILHIPQSIISFVSTVKWPSTMILVWLLLSVLFYIVPTAKVKFRYVWFGALFTTLGLMILAQAFSIYVTFFAHRVDAYKTIGTFIVLMFWLDFSGLIMLLGGVINATIQELRMGKIQEQTDAIESVLRRATKRKRK